MCGIVGYVGYREAADFLLPGLRRLEYRGYDSSGVVTITPQGRFALTKAAGRLDRLTSRLADSPANGHIGIGHTRWATHGAATDINAHPHLGGDQAVAVVHNGVIENYRLLKEYLTGAGYVFRSATDTEVIGHLIADCLEKELAATAHHPARRGQRRLCATDRRRERRALQAARHVWTGDSVSRISRRAYRGPARQPAGRGRGRERALRGQRRLAAGGQHRQDRLHGRERAGRDHRRFAPRHPPRPGRSASQRADLGHAGRRRRAGRLRALHAQGDLRAARGVAKRHARSAQSGRGHGRTSAG